MEKLASILAVVEDFKTDTAVLDKSIALARIFHARVDLLVRQPSQVGACVAHCAALGCADVAPFVTADEPLTQAILRRLRAQPADLVVKRLAPSDTRRFWLAAVDDSLAECCPAPLLLLRDRPWPKEPRFAAAVDVADRDTEALSRGILHAGGFLALGCEARLDILYCEREQHEQTLRMERAVRLARLVREFHVGGERLQMFDGVPERTLPELVRVRQYDVLVAGAVSRRNKLRSSFGTLTSALIDATAGDVLLVKTDACRDPAAVRPALTGEQFAHQF